MNKKVFYWIFSILAVLSLLVMALGGMLNPQQPGQALTLWTLATIFCFQPLFNYSLGAICAVKLFPKIRSGKWRLTCLTLAILLTLIFIFIALAELSGNAVRSGFLGLLRQFFSAPGYFLVPGGLLGFGLFSE